MSSTTTTTTTTTDRRTYWCHECDMSISLLPPTSTNSSSSSSLCPHCNSDFLEELDSPITFNPNPNPNHHQHHSNHLLFPSFIDPSSPTSDYPDGFHFPPSDTPPDNLVNNPYFHRVINHLFNPDYQTPPAGPTSSRLHSPASKSAIESIPSVKITTVLLETDPIIICAVCKDQFVVNDETKELPCKHMYHPECIIPWLSQRNSCPVCRFQMPVDDPVDGGLKVRRRNRSRVLRLGDLVDNGNGNDVDVDVDVDDEELLGFGLRHLARRHRLVFPMRRQHLGSTGEGEGEVEVLFSPTQIGEEVRVDVVRESGRTNSVETVSSWPSWPVDGGEIEMGSRVSEDDDDVVMS